MPAGATLVGGVALDTALSPNVSIVAVDPPRTSRREDAAATGTRSRLRATDIRGETTVEVRDGGIALGAAAQTWDGRSGAQEGAVDVAWVPIAEGPRRLRIFATVINGERSDLDNAIDVAANAAHGGPANPVSRGGSVVAAWHPGRSRARGRWPVCVGGRHATGTVGTSSREVPRAG